MEAIIDKHQPLPEINATAPATAIWRRARAEHEQSLDEVVRAELEEYVTRRRAEPRGLTVD